MLKYALRYLLLALTLATAQAAPHPWADARLLEPPQTYPATGFEAPGVESLFFEGVPFRGKPTRVAAYLGLPAHAAGEKVPAMVLVHGGGGTAFPQWVKLWNERGYAAIAMDTCGALPIGPDGNRNRARHEHSGPPGWGGFDQTADAPEDQWTFHAVAAVIRAHSLLRSRPEVDSERIGLTGISWGGYLTSIVSGVDARFRCAIPVYGCGFLGEDSAWLGEFAKLGPETAKTWLQRWDPSVYLPQAKLPMLWVNGTNDFAYPLDSHQKSYRLPTGSRTLCIRVRMPHGHTAGWAPKEIGAFADHILKGGPSLAKVSASKLENGRLSATYDTATPPAKAELNFTRDAGRWQDRKWETLPAQLDPEKKTIQAEVPAGARVAYLNLIDPAGLVVSTEHAELP